ncbi:MAG: FGGY-family carbohydrate kinase [Nitrososphaeria archaeon]
MCRHLPPCSTALGPVCKGVLVGLTGGTGRAQIARATLESIAYLNRDVIEAMVRDIGTSINSIKVDGGGKNNFLMQFQADITGMEILRPYTLETTAQGQVTLQVWPQASGMA